eukprot:s133_g9.t1
MGQTVPRNYGMLVFGTALPLKENFDPSVESIHGLIAEVSSGESEAPPAVPREECSAEAEEPRASSDAPEAAHPQPEGEGGSTEVEEPRPFWDAYDEDQEMEVAAEQWVAEEGEKHKPLGRFQDASEFLEGTREFKSDWLRDLVEPVGYQDRHDIDATLWSENFRMYRRDELIQADLEWLQEAVFDFYQRHLDNLIRSNERLWGDFCKRNEDEHGNTEDEEGNSLGLEMAPPPGGFLPNKEYKLNKFNIVPFPEKHFSFSTKMMLLAIQLYQERADHQFHPFTQFAYEKLESYVESKKQLTKESYRHFVEHAYNQFFVEEMDDDVPMPEEKRPDPYSEFPDEMKVDEDQQEPQEEQPHETKADQEVPDVPTFEVKIREPKDTSSPQEEEVSGHKEGSEEPEEPYETILIYDSEEERFGQFIMSHFSEADQLCWRQLVLGLRNVNVREEGEDPPNLPQTLDEVTPWQMTLMMELIASERFHAIMTIWTPALGIDISYDKMHELRLEAEAVKLKTKDIHLHHFANDAKPELPRPELESGYAGDPEFREMEDLENKPNKFAIEGEDDTLIDLTVQWLNMFNKETMKTIMKKMIKEEDKDTITLKREESADLGLEDDEDREDGIIHLRNDDGEMISPELAALFKEFCRQQREKEKKRKREKNKKKIQFFHLQSTSTNIWKVDLEERPVFNNYFVTAIKNLGAHIFLNCEASAIYPHKEEFLYNGWTYAFNDYHDLLCMARVGKDGYVRRIAGYDTEDDDTRERYVSWAIFEIKFGTTVDRASREEEEELTHARLHMVRTCVYHVSQKRISSAAGICGEAIATMVWECMKYQVDIIAGDGNKACYYPTPAKPCVPTYEVLLIQFWIDRILNCATQDRLKNFQPNAAPVRVKHFITASFTDLMFLKEKLFRVTTNKYTDKLAKETDRGDCCMMSIVDWGHARVVIEEYLPPPAPTFSDLPL